MIPLASHYNIACKPRSKVIQYPICCKGFAYITTFTILPFTMITFFGALPASHF